MAPSPLGGLGLDLCASGLYLRQTLLPPVQLAGQIGVLGTAAELVILDNGSSSI
ncbi:hypothetical protein [Streptomyces sp. NPDC001930]|uniref:hypothetical protein n=1 Tax=Streptomyces sp. NPDC001930 TaxID=3364625 RepID=UPI003681F3AA